MEKVRSLILVFLAGAFLFAGNARLFAQKSPGNSGLEIIPDEQEAFLRFPDRRVSKETGAALALYRVNFQAAPADAETMARQYLRENAAMLKLRPDLADLLHTSTRETPGGFHVRFQQQLEGFPVYRGDLAVTIDRRNTITFVMNSYKPKARLQNTQPVLSLQQAAATARSYLGIRGSLILQREETVVYYNQGRTRLAHKITVVPAEDTFGDWEVLVDAHSGEIFRVADRSAYGEPKTNTPTTGSGWVFDPDPLTRARAFYQAGGQFGDNNDADSDSLTAQLVEKDLLQIEFSGGQFRLEGPYAHIVDLEAPFEGVFSQADSNWHFTRSPQAFEAANVYYHIDKSMRYINETLGFNLMPFQYSGGVHADPHGLSGADNSHYVGSTGHIAWGEGGVDDSEDEDVLLHELGHGIHDWITNGNLSQVDGLSEGSGDYWAASYNRSTGFWTPADPQYFWVFQWDGHNQFWGGRITNYGAHYPEGLVGQIHTDGQIWASTLMQVYDDIGRRATDENFLEALSMTNGSSSQADAAQAFVQADVTLHGGANLNAIAFWFNQRGYQVTVPAPQISFTPLPDTENLNGPYLISATVSSGSGAPITEVSVIFGTGGIFTDTLALNPSGNQWFGLMPGIGDTATYNYYLVAVDSFGVASSEPPGAPTEFFSFFAGPDNTPPSVVHTPLPDQYRSRWPAIVEAEVTDNLGIDTVIVEYSINNGALSGAFPLTQISGDTFSGVFDVDTTAIAEGDSVAYRIVARDAAAAGNQTTDPLSGFHHFTIIEFLGEVLIISDESGATSANLMASILPTLNFGAEVQDAGSTDPNDWVNFDLVVSASGFNSDPLTNAAYRTALENWVSDPRHKLIVEGGEVGHDALTTPGYPSFAANVLHADSWVADAFGPLTRVPGQENHPLVTIPNALPTILLVNFSGNASKDAVTVPLNSTVVYQPSNLPGDAGISVYDDNVDPRSAQIVYLAFNFADLTNTTAASQLLENAVTYLLTPEDIVGIGDQPAANPQTFALEQNYPNPFNPTTTISYRLPRSSKVRLVIYNALGQVVRTLLKNEEQPAGVYRLRWDGLTQSGAPAASGIYLYKIVAGEFTQTRKMILMK